MTTPALVRIEEAIALSDARFQTELRYIELAFKWGGYDNRDEFVGLAGCTLDEHPDKSNWVEDGGGLPQYICEVAKSIKKTGKSTSTSIAIAISQIKRWIADPDTKPDTKVKAAAAIAEWEQLKLKAHAKSSAKAAAKTA